MAAHVPQRARLGGLSYQFAECRKRKAQFGRQGRRMQNSAKGVKRVENHLKVRERK